jgi:hypothetical protein
MVVNIVETGMLYNAYNTPVETFHNLSEVDCFLGGLVATGIPPQMTAGTSPGAQPLLPRVKFWLDSFRRFGFATESSIAILHYDDMLLIGLSGGTQTGDIRGLYAGSATTPVQFPPIADNTTLLFYFGYHIPSANISYGEPSHKTFSIFAASTGTAHLSGGFWSLSHQQVMETIVHVDGTKGEAVPVFPGLHGALVCGARLSTLEALSRGAALSSSAVGIHNIAGGEAQPYVRSNTMPLSLSLLNICRRKLFLKH